MQYLSFTALLASAFFFDVDAASASSPGLSASSTSTSTSADPSATILKRRRTHNCNQNKELRDIEARAWADAGALAEIASQYDNGNKWQPAMDYWMGKDSVKSSNFYKIQNVLSNQKKIHHPNWIAPEAVVDIYCGDTDPVLCPRFFEEKNSLEYILYHIVYHDLTSNNADSWAFFASGAWFQEALKLTRPAPAPNDCNFWGPDLESSVDDENDWDLIAPLNRTDGTFYLKEPPNPAPENTPPDDPPMPQLPYTATALPSDLARPFAPGAATAYFASYQPKSASAPPPAATTTLATSTTIPTPLPASTAVDDTCNCAYRILFDQFQVSGKNFPADKIDKEGKAGEGLRQRLANCGGLTHWRFDTIPNNGNGMQWIASGRLIIGTKSCVGKAVQAVGGDSPDQCTGAG